jgi:phosphoglycolate phosphatase
MPLLLFDIDGTLLLSDGVGRRTIREALSTIVGRPVSSDSVSFSGRTDPAIMRDVLRESGCSEEEAQELLPACLETFAEIFADRVEPRHMTVLPGVHRLLDTVTQRYGKPLGLVTGNLEVTAWAKLRAAGLEDWFTFGAYGSDHENRNLLPGVALDRARAHGFEPVRADRAVIIGDTEHDIGCSRHAGMSVVAVATGRIGLETLRAHGPDLLLEDLENTGVIISFLDDVAAR